ncbi:ArsA-related P-loop ATPase [Streptomyces sp. G-G2]|uniref:ArsA family ATPase n=1 Tax=Streptomyces sp. G-G2 TaxID=3046201 RepID=UPI0024BB445E|nr:ArsA-related P-loop ATPase [Streptomyces sp. G-G2]MDJ0383331.1 ArsA-related P-loop ATPase [Streptomyces sp. G-G2]
MHTLLITGPGGSGRTTVTAATALAAARRGRRVLVLSGDPGDPLGALLGPALGAPVEVGAGLDAVPVAAEGLWAARIDSGDEVRAELVALQERGSAVLGMLGARPLGAEELTELPGAEQFALLRALRRAAGAARSGAFDLVVVDMPPVHQAIAALALPAQLRRYLSRLLPAQRQAARALRPVLAQLAGVPMPAQWLYEAAARWDEELAAVQAVVEADTTSVRMVAEPGPGADAALRLGMLGLALHQLPVGAVVANRLVPRGSADPWLAGLAAQQDTYVAAWAKAHPGAAGPGLAHLGADPGGPRELAALDCDALAAVPRGTRPEWAVEDRTAEDGVLVWAVPLPGAQKPDLDLVRRGDELLLTAGPFRRIVSLPSALRRCTVSGAGLHEGTLRIRFTPDPGQWPLRP